jgi:dynein light chain 1
LDEVGATLQQLWISYNLIEKLEGLQSCTVLHTLFISNNKIASMDEINRLQSLPEIKNVLLLGNKIYDGMTKEEVRPLVIRRCP